MTKLQTEKSKENQISGTKKYVSKPLTKKIYFYLENEPLVHYNLVNSKSSWIIFVYA